MNDPEILGLQEEEPEKQEQAGKVEASDLGWKDSGDGSSAENYEDHRQYARPIKLSASLWNG